MAIYASLTKAYATAIYIDGSKRFPEIRQEYVEPVKQFASGNYTDEQITNALDMAYITNQEFDDTMAYKYPTV